MRIGLCLLVIFVACNKHQHLSISTPQPPANAVGGTAFYKRVAAMKWNEREPLAIQELASGNMPSFLKQFVAIKVYATDSSGKKISAIYYVSPDYLAIGNDQDWARIPLTPMTAQLIADTLQCFLPTRKMVNDIYKQSAVALEPVPLYAYRDSAISFWHHHLIIEGQRNNRKGLISGIKKDVVISGKVIRDTKSNRVAIYGWHKPDGKPIQPLYTGHVDWYVDYSHGIRLVYRKILVNGKWKDYTEILNDRTLRALLCDEEYCDFSRYPRPAF